jgi:Transposase DDE domain
MAPDQSVGRFDWNSLIGRLQDCVDLEATSRRCGAIRRKRVITSAEQLLRLLLAYVLGGLSFRATAAWAEAAGQAAMSDVALLKRTRNCGPWLRMLVQTLAGLENPQACAGEAQPIVAVDATMICSPGDTQDYAVLHTVYDVGAQCFLSAELTDRHTAERLDVGTIRPGEIRIGDRAYATWRGLHAVVAAGADYLVRLSAKAALTLRTPAGAPISRAHACRRAEACGVQDIDLVVHEASRGEGETMPARLIILPLPPDRGEAARRQMRKKAQKWGYHPTEDGLATAGCLMLVTSLPRQSWPALRLLELYRRRWQVELAFKRLKSLIGLEALRVHDRESVTVWIHAVLLVALLIDRERPSRQGEAPDSPHWDTAAQGDRSLPLCHSGASTTLCAAS